MRKNRSFKENSFARSKGSRGKEISIELQKSKPSTSTPYDLQASHQNATDRLNASSNWHHNPSISHNILKEIINYSNISQISNRASKGATIAVFDKSGDNVLTQLAKINKKSTSITQLIPRKQAKRLTLQFVQSKQSKTPPHIIEMSKSLAFQSNQSLEQKGQGQSVSGCKSINIFQISPEQRMKLQIEKGQIASTLQQLTIVEQSIQNQHSDMIPYWQKMMVCEAMITKLQNSVQKVQNNLAQYKNRLEQLNLSLFTWNKDFILSRRQWDSKGNGARGQLLEQAQQAHQQFLRRLTVKDFEDTVLFNIKVAIPQYKGKTNVRGIYQQLFRNRCAKKFTMILKKHSSHMDLYDGRLLSDFTKRINDLESLFFKAEVETKHPDNNFLDPISQIVSQIDQIRSLISKQENDLRQLKQRLQNYRQQNRCCQQSIHKLIDELNSQVRGEYERQTYKQADFKALLLGKSISMYRQFKTIRQRRQKMSEQASRIQQKLGLMPYDNS